ncbi:MAG: serine/threonine protein kinase, partial [Pirellulaceae bacterium]
AVWRQRSFVSSARDATANFEEQLFPPGTEMGNYVLQETLGTGNMGCVVKAYHRRMKREVALKFISPELTNSRDACVRFQREIEAAARLQHPNLVAAHDAGEFDGRHFLAMEYIRGRDLRRVIRRAGNLGIKQTLQYVSQAARGLEHAHKVGVVHRDIKPSNLILDERDVVKVLDLGLARLIAPDAKSPSGKSIERKTDDRECEVSRTGILVGTTAFMSPEQCAGTKEIDHRTDIYSLGCTLYYLLTSRNVFQEETAIAMLRAHAERETPSIRVARVDCPKSVDVLFQSMLAKNPEDRPQTMGAVVEQLELILREIDSKPIAMDSVVCASTEMNGSSSNANRLKLGLVFCGISALLICGLYFSGLFFDAGTPSPDLNGTAPIVATNGSLNSARSPQIDLVRIEPGKFMMGSRTGIANAAADEKPEHEVQISRSFLIGKFEITVGQFREVMGDEIEADKVTVSVSPTATTQGAADKLPVSGLSWLDAVLFCNRLSEHHGFSPFYRVAGDNVSVLRGSTGYRLPTEAEWEYACRAKSKSMWHFGDSIELLGDFAWFADNSSGEPHAVGMKKPNAFGIHDMHGNVPEWCWDRYDPNYFAVAEAIDPPGSSRGKERVFRGGGMTNHAWQTRSSSRNPLGMRYGFFNGIGLRVARTAE